VLYVLPLVLWGIGVMPGQCVEGVPRDEPGRAPRDVDGERPRSLDVVNLTMAVEPLSAVGEESPEHLGHASFCLCPDCLPGTCRFRIGS